MTTTDPRPERGMLRRREVLATLGGLGAGALWLAGRGAPALAQAAAAARRATSAGACVLTPEVTAGPYYIANHLTRRNVTENQPGLALQLHLKVQDASTCKPISGADVEIWHANAVGVYSGYSAGTAPGGPGSSGGGGHVSPNNKKTFLRGHQRSNSSGLVVFDTIYPGWYAGRAPHIHVKVHVGGSVVHTGQLFFRDSVSDAVYRTVPYRSHGEPDTSDAQDSIYQQEGGTSAILELTTRPNHHGFIGSLTMGVRT